MATSSELSINDLSSDLLSEVLLRCPVDDRRHLSTVSKTWRAVVKGDVRSFKLAVNLSRCDQQRLLSFFEERGASMQTLHLDLSSPSAAGASTAQALFACCANLRSLHLEEATLQQCRLAPHLPQLRALSIGRLYNSLASHHRFRGGPAEPNPFSREPLSLFQLRGLTKLAVGLSAHWVGGLQATFLDHLPLLTALRELSVEAQWTRPYDATPRLVLPAAITALQALERLVCLPDIRFPAAAVGGGLLLPRLTHLEMSYASAESLSTARTRLRLSEVKLDYLWLRDREIAESFVLLARSVPRLELGHVCGNPGLASQLPWTPGPLQKLVLGRGFLQEAAPFGMLQCLNLESVNDFSGVHVCSEGRTLASVLSRCRLRALRLWGLDCKWPALSVDTLLHNSLPYLHTLQLKSIGLEYVPPGLRAAPRLRVLDLSHNPLELSAACVTTLLALPALKSLCICNSGCWPWEVQAQAAIQGLYDAFVAAGSPHCLWCESGMGLRCYGLPGAGK